MTKIAAAAEWLEGYLQRNGGKMASKQIKADGAVAKHNEANLKRARSRVGAKVIDEGFPRVTHWALPGWEAKPVQKPRGMTGADWGAWVRSGNHKRPNSTVVRVI